MGCGGRISEGDASGRAWECAECERLRRRARGEEFGVETAIRVVIARNGALACGQRVPQKIGRITRRF